MTVALGSRLSKRHAEDFYRTPPECTSALLAYESFSGPIWEPACGDGAISEVLKSAGHDVFSTDLIDRGYGFGELDFLAQGQTVAPTIVTNPPFKLADAFVLHSLSLGVCKIAMLLRLTWLEGEARRRKLFQHYPPSRVWIFSRRPTLWNGDDPDARTTGGAIAYGWFIWDRDHVGPPTLGWIAQEKARCS